MGRDGACSGATRLLPASLGEIAHARARRTGNLGRQMKSKGTPGSRMLHGITDRQA
jgi:hypothetical protein